MNCKQWMLYQEGSLSARDFQAHAQTCRACREQEKIAQALGGALAVSAPAALVDQVFARTTRRPGLWQRWKWALAGSAVALVLAAGIGLHVLREPVVVHSDLVAYMSQVESDEYADFLQDLDLFEQEF